MPKNSRNPYWDERVKQGPIRIHFDPSFIIRPRNITSCPECKKLVTLGRVRGKDFLITVTFDKEGKPLAIKKNQHQKVCKSNVAIPILFKMPLPEK